MSKPKPIVVNDPTEQEIAMLKMWRNVKGASVQNIQVMFPQYTINEILELTK